MCQVLAETQQREEEEGDEEQKQMEAQRVQTSNSATDNRKAGKKKGEEKPLLCHFHNVFQLHYVLTLMSVCCFRCSNPSTGAQSSACGGEEP